MYLAVGLVVALILLFAWPAIWLAWWLLAGLGERTTARPGGTYARRRAA
jgi:hypothetical protein